MLRTRSAMCDKNYFGVTSAIFRLSYFLSRVFSFAYPVSRSYENEESVAVIHLAFTGTDSARFEATEEFLPESLPQFFHALPLTRYRVCSPTTTRSALSPALNLPVHASAKHEYAVPSVAAAIAVASGSAYRSLVVPSDSGSLADRRVVAQYKFDSGAYGAVGASDPRASTAPPSRKSLQANARLHRASPSSLGQARKIAGSNRTGCAVMLAFPSRLTSSGEVSSRWSMRRLRPAVPKFSRESMAFLMAASPIACRAL